MRERRRDLGLSQQQLADVVEVNRQTIVSIVSGDYAPSVFLALEIAERSPPLWSASGRSPPKSTTTDKTDYPHGWLSDVVSRHELRQTFGVIGH
ncbi:helix-turn-helix transcriptional regulator [Actinoplanes sp. NEAU-A12]|uniref:Helix-turn-helix transcriptional regulator n=2 Tax=Actinoplanes sandaracinus TaxID=3045177 RepID=A0ABT6WB83_9ACTN|nr:helix-turn-helix transcriptional regulator [Actinoplanes sandaracinus]